MSHVEHSPAMSRTSSWRAPPCRASRKSNSGLSLVWLRGRVQVGRLNFKYVYIHYSIHAYPHVYIHTIDTHTHTYLITYVHTCIHIIYTHTYINTYMHTYIHTDMHTHTHTYMATVVALLTLVRHNPEVQSSKRTYMKSSPKCSTR